MKKQHQITMLKSIGLQVKKSFEESNYLYIAELQRDTGLKFIQIKSVFDGTSNYTVETLMKLVEALNIKEIKIK